MRLSLLFFISLAAAYFSSDQLELINLHYNIQPKKLSDQRTFYEILQVEPKAKSEELEKSFKRLSRKFHPDKFIRKSAKERKRAERKYETLGLVMGVLRDVTRRESYDYFLKKGFPVWDSKRQMYKYPKRDTSLFIVVGFLFIIATIVQVSSLKLNKNRKNKKVKQVMEDVRRKALSGSANKVIELPDEFDGDLDAHVSDELVVYMGSIFVVSKDIWILDEEIDLDDQTAMGELNQKIFIENRFNLWGYQAKEELNRKERRLNAKKKKEEITVEPLRWVKIEEENSFIGLKDLWFSKLVLSLIPKRKAKKAIVTAASPDTIIEPVQINVNESTNGTITLPNGKTIKSRKK
ncbi:Erj5 protein [Martiniozyma asiatica (nom. inval.)]|nr:Erj5 protein [Martiniozyma asiatica]